MSVLGAVLAGGRSSRFGSDKALAEWNGRTLLEHAIDGLRPFCDAIVVCGRSASGETSIPDQPRENLGPLGGLSAALHHARQNGLDRVISAPCDAPAIPTRLIEQLLGYDGPAYAAELPVLGCWPSALANALDRHLASGGARSMREWAKIAGARPLASEDDAGLVNINRQSDLARLREAGDPANLADSRWRRSLGEKA